MANYESCTRTNYFAVTDEEKLKNIVAHIRWGGGELDFLDKENGKWGFGGYGSISGLDFNDVKFNDDDDCDDGYEEEDEWEEYDEWAPDAVYEALQEVVSPDDAIIITEIGYENLRHLNAHSIIITRYFIDIVELRTSALSRACEMLNNPEYDTQMDY